MSEHAIMNLMDLAALDTSDMSAQMSRLQRQGIYFLEVVKAGYTEQESNDAAKATNYNLMIESTILEFIPLDETEKLDMSKIIGATFKERYFLFGEQLIQSIQLLMGMYKSVGLRCKGAMGGVEGSEPGWVDEIAGKRIIVRVQHRTGNDGQERANIYWLTPKQMKKLGIPLDALGRDLLDEQGNPLGDAA